MGAGLPVSTTRCAETTVVPEGTQSPQACLRSELPLAANRDDGQNHAHDRGHGRDRQSRLRRVFLSHHRSYPYS